MTEIPALRDALVEAAARRRPAPRIRRLVPALVPLAGVAALVAVIFVVAGRPARDTEQPAVAPPGGSPSFAVLERPKTAADAVPGHPDWNSRLVARAHGVRLWLVPLGGQVCAMAQHGVTLSGTCAAATPGGSGWGMVWRILPDDAVDVRVTLMDGRQVTPRVRDNGLLLTRPRDYAALGWTRGRTRYVRQLATPYGPAPGSCPRLAALPAHWRAGVARVALRSLDMLYRDLVQARVTSVGVATDTPCPGADPARSVAVNLRLLRTRGRVGSGQVLLGRVGGRMTLYTVAR